MNGRASSARSSPFQSTANAIVDAAALQDHFSKSLNLSGCPTRRRKRSLKPSRKLLPAKPVVQDPEVGNQWGDVSNGWTCDSCTLWNEQASRICVACMTRRPRSGRPRGPSSLAVKRGLVKGPPEPLSRDQWEDVLRVSDARRDSYFPCPICQQEFGEKPQIITSCSHVFHKNCLESFERFVRQADQCCPICRTKDYEKLASDLGVKAHRNVKATVIQSCWRGSQARVKYKADLARYYAQGNGNVESRQKYYARRLTAASDELTRVIDAKGDSIDRMFREWDQSVLESRRILDHSVKAAQTVSQERDTSGTELPERWKHIKQEALRRGLGDCPICVNEMSEDNDHEPLSLMSCTHVFHTSCIVSFENFHASRVHTCPLCREQYERMPM